MFQVIAMAEDRATEYKLLNLHVEVVEDTENYLNLDVIATLATNGCADRICNRLSNDGDDVVMYIIIIFLWENCTPNQDWACFLHYLKIINTSLKNE